MTDPVPDTKAPKTRWMWVGVIALLAIAFIGFMLFGSQQGDIENIPDYATTTQEERLNQDLPLAPSDDLPPVRGAESDNTVTAEGGEVEVVDPPEANETPD